MEATYKIHQSGMVPTAVGLYCCKEYFEFLKKSDEDDVVWDFLQFLRGNYRDRLFAQNGSKVESKLVLDCLTRHNEKAVVKGGLKYLGWEQNTFLDSQMLFGIGLRQACEAGNIDRSIAPYIQDFKATDEDWGTFTTRLDSFRPYLKMNVITLDKALEWFAAFCIGKLGIEPLEYRKGGIPSLSNVAMKLCRKKFYNIGKTSQNLDYYPMFNAATYATRNEVFTRYGENVSMYDINSMYLSTYGAPMPVGVLEMVPEGMMSIDRGTTAYAKVKVPQDSYIGPLPHMYEGHLIFPTGEFEGQWDMLELRNAVVNHGVDVQLIRQWECKEEVIFDKYANFILDIKYSGNPGLSKMANLLGHRLVNKLGQKRFGTCIKHCSDMTPEEWEGSTPIDEMEVYHEIEMKHPKYNADSRWAMRMRMLAVARLRHTNMLLEASRQGKIYYCDTDSVHTNIFLPVSRLAGELKLVGEGARAYYIKQKCYAWVERSGKFTPVTSGYRWDSDHYITEEDFKQLLAGKGKEVVTEVNVGIRDIIKGRNLTRERISKIKPSSDYPNRIYSGIESMPICLPVKDRQMTMAVNAQLQEILVSKGLGG